MKNATTKHDGPSAASLAEMPEVDFSRAKKLPRGKHAARARKSLEVVVLDKKLVARLGGPDAVRRILQVLSEAIDSAKRTAA